MNNEKKYLLINNNGKIPIHLEVPLLAGLKKHHYIELELLGWDGVKSHIEQKVVYTILPVSTEKNK